MSIERIPRNPAQDSPPAVSGPGDSRPAPAASGAPTAAKPPSAYDARMQQQNRQGQGSQQDLPDLTHVFTHLRSDDFKAAIRRQLEDTGKVQESDLDKQTTRMIERACDYLKSAGKPMTGAAQVAVAIAAAKNPEAYGLCIQKLAALRLAVDAASGTAWITAKYDNQKQEYKLAQMEGIRGLERVLGEEAHILSVDYGVAREGDAVNWKRGTSPELTITPATLTQEQADNPNSRAITHGFAIVRVKDRDPIAYLFQPTKKQLEYKGVMTPEQALGYYAYRNVLRKAVRLFTTAAIDPEDSATEITPDSNSKTPKV